MLRRAAGECDAIVTSGGVSMGEYDVVKAVLGRIADMTWMQIAIKPAKPFAFGTLDGKPIFGLPGNPVSSIDQLRDARPAGVAPDDGAPALGSAEHRRHQRRRRQRRPDGKVHLVRVAATFENDGRCHVRSVGAQGSHQLAATACPTRSPSCPTVTASRPAPKSPS